MAWRGEVGGEPVSPYRFVEDVLGDQASSPVSSLLISTFIV
jgi:hypothetical protein